MTTAGVDAPATLLGEWARLIAGTLVASGVREVVVSPGSRSTPFLLALAERTRELALVEVLDERAAAFVALGMSRASGRAVALLCTSGTAPAHWYPAVIEASLTDVPLVCMSADRPLEHAHCGAAQTIDQVGLFGGHVRFFADLGAPDASESALIGARRTIAQAIALARGPSAGPVHLNLRARKPLEPRPPQTDAELALRARVERLGELPVTQAARTTIAPAREAIEEAARAIAAARRPWLAVGPLPPAAAIDGTRDALLAIARDAGAPMFAEATSQLRFAGERRGALALDALDLALRDPRAADDGPDLIVQVGGTPTSGALERFVAARPSLARVVLGVSRWTDPHGTARAMVLGERATTLQAIAGALRGAARADEAWAARWAERERAAWLAIEAELGSAHLGEGAVALAVARALPRGALLTVGNSLPVRTIDRYVRGVPALDLVVCSQRGANGIDGLVSGAIGASIATERPGALMLGDLSLLHDLGGLASARLVRAPLAIVVVQNGGGRIFEQLPIASAAPAAMPRFVTPHDVRLEHAAALFGLPFARAEEPATLRAALERALAQPGATLIEAIVPPHDARDAEARLVARVRGEAS